LNARIKKIFVITQYLASSLNQHIKEAYHFDLFDGGFIQCLSPEETASTKIFYKGTADAIRQNLDNILKVPVSYFVVLSGDQLYHMNFNSMLKFAKDTDADMTIASLCVQEEEAKRMGLLKVDQYSHVTDFCEKPQDPHLLSKFKREDKYLGSMGIYVFKREALIALLNEKGEDFGKHLIPIQVKKGKTAAFQYKGYWEDIGTVASYFKANLALTDSSLGMNFYDELHPIYTQVDHLPLPLIKECQVIQSIIGSGSIIEAKEISRSVVGVRSVIKKGTVIRKSILMGNECYASAQEPLPSFHVGEDCLIENAIIDERVCIGNRVKLVNREKRQTFDGNGIYIREGIIIVPSGTTLPDDFTL
jgi:glucose-1-phosphate adenylyltransferase